MNNGKPERSRYSNRNTPLAFLLSSFISMTCSAGEYLVEGNWKGTFLTHDGSRYKISYLVSYSDDSKPEIDMIYVGMQPRSKFTYSLTDIIIKKKKLWFKIPKEFETKDCELTYKEDQYAGTCTSDAGGDDEVGEITMTPPPKPEPEEEREDTDSNSDDSAAEVDPG